MKLGGIESMKIQASLLLLLFCLLPHACGAERPNIILMMADDQGWGETGYNGHPRLKTPNLDAMSESGLRFDRFYAAAPVCSPTRASVLTGRTNMRTGVESHGYALRLQEKSLASALAEAGYATGHFGKWHLNGLRGPGVPILADDNHNPGVFGFQEWLSVTNFFDRDPILSRKGAFEEYEGDSSEVVVDEALKFIEKQAEDDKPFFTVIWFGTPHSPFRASDEDMEVFADLDEKSRNHYGELVALDRSVGTMRAELRRLGVAKNTLFWYCSDNGGLPKINPETVGGLRGFKGTIYEGGLRVPGIIEWPDGIRPQVTKYSACAMDIFPTLADIVGLPDDSFINPQDGISLRPLFGAEPKSANLETRDVAIPFQCFGNTAILRGNWKLLRFAGKGEKPKTVRFELYNLAEDDNETQDLFSAKPAIAADMQAEMERFLVSLARSVDGKDYPEGAVNPGEPEPRFWTTVDAYKPYFDDWRGRPEYQSWMKNKLR